MHYHHTAVAHCIIILAYDNVLNIIRLPVSWVNYTKRYVIVNKLFSRHSYKFLVLHFSKLLQDIV